MKIWKVCKLLPVALLIIINKTAAQQSRAIVYTEHSCNSIPEQAVSMTSPAGDLHVNWFNISIEQSPGLTADRQHARFRLYMPGTQLPSFDARPPSIPVSIVSIKAALKKTAVQISWEAREEHQLNLYEVERSTDGVNFQTVGLVFPWDNQESSNNYEFRDEHPLPGFSYYRLRSINKDSSFTWSVIVPAGKAPQSFNTISIMPNPVKGNIRAVFSRLPKATYNIELRSVSGTLHLKRTINIQQAEQLEILEPGYVPPGIYWLAIFDHSNQKLGSGRVVIR